MLAVKAKFSTAVSSKEVFRNKSRRRSTEMRHFILTRTATSTTGLTPICIDAYLRKGDIQRAYLSITVKFPTHTFWCHVFSKFHPRPLPSRRFLPCRLFHWRVRFRRPASTCARWDWDVVLKTRGFRWLQVGVKVLIMAEKFKSQDYYAMLRQICPELEQSNAPAVSSKSSV